VRCELANDADESVRRLWKESLFHDEDREVLMFAALGHDFGKPVTVTTDEHGAICFPDHANAAAKQLRKFLDRMRPPNRIVNRAIPLVRESAMTLHSPTPGNVRRLACRLSPANIRQWVALCHCDAPETFSSRCSESPPRLRGLEWLKMAVEISVCDGKPDPIIQGRHLLSLGVSSGPEMGKILEQAFLAQLDGVFTDLHSGLEWLRERLKTEF
ncbi:MAG: HD domain-containing protein, partial [Planctomycetia bacterium]|nr:HD domain-containing protein [Planctomycetia bacterium]